MVCCNSKYTAKYCSKYNRVSILRFNPLYIKMSDRCKCRLKTGERAGKQCGALLKGNNKFGGRHTHCAQSRSPRKNSFVKDFIRENDVEVLSAREVRQALIDEYGKVDYDKHRAELRQAVRDAVRDKMDRDCRVCAGKLDKWRQ